MSLTRRAGTEALEVARPGEPDELRPVRPRPAAGVLVLLVAGCLAATLAGVGITGAALPSLLVDPGPAVRWGLPLARGLADLAAALTVGALVLAATVLPARPGRARTPRPVRGGVAVRPGRPPAALQGPPRAHAGALLAATAAAGVWAVAALSVLVLTYADVAGIPPDAPGFGDQLGAFALQLDLGRELAFGVAFAAAVALLAAGASTLRAAALLALLALAGLSPLAFAGHASGRSSHETAVSSLGLHLIGVSVWVGGLGVLLLLWRGLPAADRPVAAQRFSTLAGWCFAAVGFSGVLNAWIRVGGPDGLASSYGVLLGLKVLALAGLGAAGWWHRRRTLAGLSQGRGGFARLAAAEVALMGVATGFAVALSRSAPPVTDALPIAPSPAQALTGYPLPPAPTPVRWLTEWQPDLFWVLLIGLGAGLYAAGVLRLRRRGVHWPLSRTLPWLAGLLLCLYVTCGPPAAYGRLLFSSHMLGHMLQGMVVPALLVLGAPVTLALRTLPARRDGSRGPREWLLAALHSAPSRLLTHPVVAGALFAGGLVVFYWSPLFGVALRTHLGHEAMHLHFLFAGYLFAWVLVGVDPGPRRAPSPPLRMILLLAVMAFHAFLGVALLSGSTVLAADWFAALQRPWGGSLLADQRLGGGIAWAIGEIPTMVLEVVMAVQWSRSDEREARRRDRQADRDGDAELTAYNEMLARLGQRNISPAAPRAGQDLSPPLIGGPTSRDSKEP